MKPHVAYIKYLIRHKFYVFYAGTKIGVNWFQLLIHDWQKFMPYEYRGYIKAFYTPDGKGRAYREDNEHFKHAWNHHQKHCKHHWQYWFLRWDRGEDEALRIPHKYVKEMVADWFGAGKAITGKWEAAEWYEKNKDKIILHPETRKEIEKLIDFIKKLV